MKTTLSEKLIEWCLQTKNLSHKAFAGPLPSILSFSVLMVFTVPGFSQTTPSAVPEISAELLETLGKPTLPVERELTAADGRKTLAIILDKSAGGIKGARVADKLKFTLPHDKLTEPDREFLDGFRPAAPVGKKILYVLPHPSPNDYANLQILTELGYEITIAGCKKEPLAKVSVDIKNVALEDYDIYWTGTTRINLDASKLSADYWGEDGRKYIESAVELDLTVIVASVSKWVPKMFKGKSHPRSPGLTELSLVVERNIIIYNDQDPTKPDAERYNPKIMEEVRAKLPDLASRYNRP